MKKRAFSHPTLTGWPRNQQIKEFEGGEGGGESGDKEGGEDAAAADDYPWPDEEAAPARRSGTIGPQQDRCVIS